VQKKACATWDRHKTKGKKQGGKKSGLREKKVLFGGGGGTGQKKEKGPGLWGGREASQKKW